MQRKFLTSLLLIVLLNLLVKPFFIFGIDAEVQNRVGEQVYGNYFSLLNFSLLLNILLDLGTTNYNTRNIAQHPQLLAKHFFKILSLRFSLFILYGVFTLLSGLFIGYDQYEFYLLAILMVNQFLIAIVQFSRSNFTGLHLFKTDAFISVLDRSLLIIFCSFLLWGNIAEGEFQIEWFIFAQTAAYGISAVISLLVLSTKVGRIKLQIKKNFSAVILKHSFPFSLLIFLMFMYTRVDVVMIERLLPKGDAQAGIYAQGYRILDAVNMFALLFTGILLPIFARQIKEKVNISDMLSLGVRFILVMSISAGFIGFVFQESLLNLIYDNVDPSGIVTFGLLILSFIPITIIHVFGTLLTANGSLKRLNLLAVSGVLINIVLNLILIQSHGVVGAAIATLVTQSVIAIVQILIVREAFNKPLQWDLVRRFVVFSGLLAVGVVGLTMLELEFPILVQVSMSFVFALLLGLICGLVRKSDFNKLGENAPSRS